MLQNALDKLVQKQNLTPEETKALFDEIFKGNLAEDEIKALLRGFAEKGETADEIFGAASAMRASMRPYETTIDAVDIVGTGGDKLGTLNISTAAALVAAACDVPIAKHGNRAATSKSGSSDVLSALGINLEPSDEILNRCLPEIGIVFLFAPRHHPAMRFVASARKALGIRTIFNFLGPLTNPANVKRHMIGVSAEDYIAPMAEVLRKSGSKKAWLATSHNGMDELTTTGPTHILKLENNAFSEEDITPERFGLTRASLDQIKGGDASQNAKALLEILAGAETPYASIVALNAAAALVVADKAQTLEEALPQTQAALASGKAKRKLQDLIRLTNEKA